MRAPGAPSLLSFFIRGNQTRRFDGGAPGRLRVGHPHLGLITRNKAGRVGNPPSRALTSHIELATVMSVTSVLDIVL